MTHTIFRSLSGHSVYLVAATLRPETMYGQTNCWVHPELPYVAYKVTSGEIYISTERAALNMAYQEFTDEFGKYVPLVHLKGQVLEYELLWYGIESTIGYYGSTSQSSSNVI